MLRDSWLACESDSDGRSMDEEGLHPGQKSIRLKYHDYAAPASYFLTICTYEKRCLFGRVTDGHIELTALGQVVRACWVGIPEHFPHAGLHEFVIMPNHVHGIIEIGRQAGAQHAAPLQTTLAAAKREITTGSLSAIVRLFKAVVTNRARRDLGWRQQIWQRNYFERVIRDGEEFSDISRYIGENPTMWELDRENPDRRQTLTPPL